jgi:hypothetical protein
MWQFRHNHPANLEPPTPRAPLYHERKFPSEEQQQLDEILRAEGGLKYRGKVVTNMRDVIAGALAFDATLHRFCAKERGGKEIAYAAQGVFSSPQRRSVVIFLSFYVHTTDPSPSQAVSQRRRSPGTMPSSFPPTVRLFSLSRRRDTLSFSRPSTSSLTMNVPQLRRSAPSSTCATPRVRRFLSFYLSALTASSADADMDVDYANPVELWEKLAKYETKGHGGQYVRFFFPFFDVHLSSLLTLLLTAPASRHGPRILRDVGE